MPVIVGNEIGLAFVTGYRIDQTGNQYAVFYLGNVHENGYVYFNDEFMYRCNIDGTSLQILNLPSHIWCLSGLIDDINITTLGMKNLLNLLKGGNALIGTGVEAAIKRACDIADDPDCGYSWIHRDGNPDYDCSSLMYTCFRDAGFDLPSYNGTTLTMVNDFTNAGFTWYQGLGNNIDDLIRGDILLNISDHTELYIGDYQNVGAHHDENGGTAGLQPGDQGGEITVSGWYSFPWDGILRWEHGNSVTPPNNS